MTKNIQEKIYSVGVEKKKKKDVVNMPNFPQLALSIYTLYIV